jgi:hypothetical protein
MKQSLYAIAAILSFSFFLSWKNTDNQGLVVPDVKSFYEEKSDEFIKMDLGGVSFDYRVAPKNRTQKEIDIHAPTVMYDCIDWSCDKILSIQFVSKAEPFWSKIADNIPENIQLDDNAPFSMYISHVQAKKQNPSDVTKQSSEIIWQLRTSDLKGTDWSTATNFGNITTTITENKNGKISGTFTGKTLDGKEVKNGSFSLRYK